MFQTSFFSTKVINQMYENILPQTFVDQSNWIDSINASKSFGNTFYLSKVIHGFSQFIYNYDIKQVKESGPIISAFWVENIWECGKQTWSNRKRNLSQIMQNFTQLYACSKILQSKRWRFIGRLHVFCYRTIWIVDARVFDCPQYILIAWGR